MPKSSERPSARLSNLSARAVAGEPCLAILLGLCALAAAGLSATAAPSPLNGAGQVELVLKDHRFAPAEIHVPAGRRLEILLKNQDPTAEEFDSSALKIEKVVGGGKEGIVRLRPLDPGRYPFMGEFHPDTAQGVVVAE